MADFVSKNVTKSAERKLTTPVDTIANFTTLVSDFITANPLGCVSYSVAGQTIPGVVRGTEYYSGKIVYEDALAKTVGSISVKAPTQAAFNTNIITILADATLRSSMGGTPSHDSSEDHYSCSVKCHDSNGENYTVTFKRDSMVVSSYEDDSILTAVETWADTIPALA